MITTEPTYVLVNTLMDTQVDAADLIEHLCNADRHARLPFVRQFYVIVKQESDCDSA